MNEHDHFSSWLLFSVGSLAVFLGQSQGQSTQEFIHGAMHIRREVLGVHVGHDHKDTVTQELQIT